jgi:glycosyltransferase involved in cell wall biosynthesis
VHTIYHGLDTRYFAPSASEAASAAPPLVVSVGRFVEKKGFAYLVEACARLHAAGVKMRCVIVGERGPDSERIARMVREAGLEGCVELRGPVGQDALRSLYRQASLFVLPCQVVADGDRDGIPNVLAEAMATGLAVVSTDVSGIPELVSNGVDGLLVPPATATRSRTPCAGSSKTPRCGAGSARRRGRRYARPSMRRGRRERCTTSSRARLRPRGAGA